MNKNNRATNEHIVFCGAFDIGESITEQQMHTVEAAKQISGDIAVFVGDIGLGEKLGNYIRLGKQGLYDIYTRRIECATSGCIASQLPKQEQYDEVIDEAAYQHMVEILEEASPEIYAVVSTVPVSMKNEEYADIHDEYSRILREVIVPAMIEKRLDAYDLDSEHVTIYLERVFRNVAQHRMSNKKKSNKKSWLRIFDELEKKNGMLYLLMTEVLSKNNMPKCRGIMLALYEELALKGYKHVTQLYCEKNYLSLKNAEEVYTHLQKQFPQDARWELTFQDKFY